MNTLVVTNPFGGHGIGHRITDPQEIARVLAGEHAHHVVQAVHADAPVMTVADPIVLAEPEHTDSEEA